MNPIDQLADISIPDTVSSWPLAAGYWMALGLACICIGVAILWTTKYKNRNKARKNAIKALNQLDTEDQQFAPKLQVILKTVVAQYRGVDAASKSYGSEWSRFLQTLYKGKNSDDLVQLAEYLYRSLYSLPVDASRDKNKHEVCDKNTLVERQKLLISSVSAKKIALNFLENLDTSLPVAEHENANGHPFGASKC